MIAVLLASAAAALFEVHEVPLNHDDALCFFAAAYDDGAADLFVLDGFRLFLFDNAAPRITRTIEFAPDTSAFDVADLTGDGDAEVIAVRGERIVLYSLDPAAPEEPAELFSLRTQLAERTPAPFLYVLVVRHQGSPALALPREEFFELRDPQGNLLQAHPTGLDAPHHVTYGRPFSRWVADPPQTAPPGALEFQISRVLAFTPVLPDGMLPIDAPISLRRHATLRQLRDAASLDPEAWPWFSLRNDPDSRDRVRYALNDAADTLVRVSLATPPGAASQAPPAEPSLGPVRRYPGMIIPLDDDFPDFNGDGYADLLLWKAPPPAPTVDAIARAALGRAWDLRVTTHLYLPEKRRFDPKPAGHIETNAPVEWFLTGAGNLPIRHPIVRDFDGDGRMDFGASTAPNQFSVWRFTDSGFPRTPDFDLTLAQPIERIDLRAPLDGGANTSIVLRSDRRLIVLRAHHTPARTPFPAAAPVSPSPIPSPPR